VTGHSVRADFGAWKAHLARARQALGEGGPPEPYLRVVDELVRALGREGGWEAPRRGLVALGGYGRRELAPWSDLDLLFLVGSHRDKGAADEVLYPLWDLGFEVGHALRTPAECATLAARDLSVATALLDGRLLLGDDHLHRDARARAGIRPGGSRRSKGWAEEILRSVPDRRLRFGEISHLLEPHLKEGRGGLRDFHACRWVQACRGQAAAGGPAPQADGGELLGAVSFLSRARNVLHAVAGRKTDHLTFEHHRQVAARVLPGRPIEEFFAALHQAAHRVSNAWDRTAARVEPRRRPLLRRQARALAEPGHIAGELLAWSRASAPLPESLSRALETPGAGEAVRTAAQEILRRRIPLAPLLRELHRRDRLALLAPEVEAVIHRVEYDARHAFTTGVHCIETLGALEDLWLGAREREEPHLTRIAGALVRPWVVRVAALGHDLGAASEEPEHAQASVAPTLGLAKRLGLSGEEAEEAAHLVRAHQVLPSIAFSRDLEDPAAVAEAQAAAGSPTALDELLVLAYADLRATNPMQWAGAWNDWRRDLLLTVHARAFVEAEAHPDRARRAREATVAEVRRLGLPGREPRWGEIPPREASQVPPDYLARLLHLADRLGDDPAAWHLEVRGAVVEVLGVARALHHLHSNVAGALASLGFDVLSFQAHTWADGSVHLWLRATAPTPMPESGALCQHLTECVTEKRSISGRRRSPLADPRREAVPVAATVQLRDAEHPFHSVLEIQCRDRPGLLHDLTRAIEDLALSVEYALVTTHGPLARDVFHVKDIFGRRVEGADKRRALLARVAELARGNDATKQDTQLPAGVAAGAQRSEP